MNDKLKDWNRQRSQQFREHQQMLKRLLKGQAQFCPTCRQALQVSAHQQGFQIRCAKGCTDLVLER
ncbi:hypothetical protein [Aliagarivorans marinus]|uniref:hypothetical protein n=1 Tax=Aliagarivorans marinus TaxID=561965 RepID=UPI0003F7146A|nr:hypothetical protein [Aliagarivorans marinus]